MEVKIAKLAGESEYGIMGNMVDIYIYMECKNSRKLSQRSKWFIIQKKKHYYDVVTST